MRGRQAIVPSIWAFEVANVLCQAERLKKLTDLEVSEFKEMLNMLPISIDNNSTQRAISNTYLIAKTEQLTVYDAAYLEIAIRENFSLATFDKALKRSAKNKGVDLL